MPAALAIPSLTWTAQTATINKMKSPISYLQNLLFGRHRTHGVETIEVGYFVRGRKMAPMVRDGGSAIPVEGHTHEFAIVKAPNIRIKRPFQAQELFYGRQPGTSVFPTDQEMTNAVEQSIAMDLQSMRDDITNRVEWMVAQAIRGAITYSVADGEVFTLTTPRDAGNTISSLSTYWDDATPANVRYEEDIEVAQGLVHAAEGLNITHAFCGASAAKYLRRVVRASGFQLDVKGMFEGVGSIQYGAARDQHGARPIGRICGIDFYEYATALTDENGASQTMIRDKYVEFVVASNAADNVLEFGAIPDINVPGRLFRGEIFSKSWTEEDPSLLVALAHSRPLPVLWRPNSTVSMKVISG